MATLIQLAQTDQVMSTAEYIFSKEEFPFLDNEEYSIVSLAMDMPDFFSTIIDHIKPEMFRQPEAREIIRNIIELNNKYGHIPPRSLIVDFIKSTLTTAHDWRPIVELLSRKLEAREAPMIKDKIIAWARKQQYNLLYQERAIDAFSKGNYQELNKIVEKAESINAVQYSSVWLFENIDMLFTQEAAERLTCGFKGLDQFMHPTEFAGGGGPSKKEVIVWAAKTGGGKSIIMVNSGIQCAMKGKNVLHITLETATVDIMRRYYGAITKIPTMSIDMIAAAKTGKIPKNEELNLLEGKIKDQIHKLNNSSLADGTPIGKISIMEFEADSISINEIKQSIDFLRKTKSWSPDVVIIDYLELMVPRGAIKGDNESKEYLRQKKIATEVRALAQSENVLVITATQGNRKSVTSNGQNQKQEEETNMGLDKLSNSYDKAMPMDYVISINQTTAEKRDLGDPNKGRFRFFIEKNRHGPDGKVVNATVDYSTMLVTEETITETKGV